MMQNNISVIRKLIIKNDQQRHFNDLKIKISIDSDFTTEKKIDAIPAMTSVEIDDFSHCITEEYLYNLNEVRKCYMTLDILEGDETLFTDSYPLTLLPYDSWTGLKILPEMLASYVTPDAPALVPVVHKIYHFLEKFTGDPTLDEYRSRNPERIKSQMSAIFTALTEQGLACTISQVNAEECIRNIRLSNRLLIEGEGTNLDMALLYATCLEYIGLNPLIVITRQHIFAGAWLTDETFADCVNDDVTLLTDRLKDDTGEILLIDTTSFNKGRLRSFDMASIAAETYLNNQEDFILFIDIKRCRLSSIKPIPTKISEKEASSSDTDALSALRSQISAMGESVEITKQKLWERKLLDLSLRNNLLNTRLTKSALQLISIDINLLEDALADGKEFSLHPKPPYWDKAFLKDGIYQTVNYFDPVLNVLKSEMEKKHLHTYLTEGELNSVINNLYRSSRLSIEENGANTLFLALGLLKWYETSSSEKARYAPLLLLPVEIIRKPALKGYVIRSREEDVIMNVTLLEMLRQDFSIDIRGLETLPKDDSGVDVKLVFDIVKEYISKEKGWEVEEQAILGIFSFNKFIMWNDLHNNADKLCRNKIVDSLITGLNAEYEEEEESDTDSQYAPADIILPISADYFQIEAICNAAKGKSFILHGPPGTGKSQTITNIIANAVYHGKKVLFVAEKMAALSVVQKRLQDIGIAPFCLELHSNKSKKSAILEQLKITTEVTARRSPEDFLLESERLRSLRNELSGYVSLLHKKHNIGISLYEALYRYSGDIHSVPEFRFNRDLATELSSSGLFELHDIAERLQSAARFCNTEERHPLMSVGLTAYSISLRNEMRDILNRNILLSEELSETVSHIVKLFDSERSELTLSSVAAAYEITSLLSSATAIPHILLRDDVTGNVARLKEIIPHGVIRDEKKSILLNRFSEGILETDGETLLQKWQSSEYKFFAVKYFIRFRIRRILKSHSLKGRIPETEVEDILTDLAVYRKENHFINKNEKYCRELLGTLWQDENNDWDNLTTACDNALFIADKLMIMTGNIPDAVRSRRFLSDSISMGLSAFISVNSDILQKFSKNYTEYAENKKQIDEGLMMLHDFAAHNLREIKEIQKNILKNFDKLKDWSILNAIRREAEEAGFKDFSDHIINSCVSPENIVTEFDNAVYYNIINTVIDTDPLLSGFSGRLFEDKIKKFRQMTARFEKLTKEELYARLASSIPNFVREAAQSSEVGVLQRNIRNNGRGMPIRKLFDTIPNLLTRINPCMLMSPMSVAQYIDSDNIKFDLVIFDEASQMPTCEAIGAIARGDNLIVVGDPKQMPPTNFFSTNSVDEENLDKEDLESILDDCMALSMPSKHLLWHYRSKHESLIAFSNSRFYENKLLTFPSPDNINSKVTFHQIDGFYDKGKSRQNKGEAEAVVNEIIRRLSDENFSHRSIGVVTFSSVQQILIEDMLNEALSLRPDLEALAHNSQEPVFIKNLENVQGDERDIILFSVGYGPDKQGRISMNFGPLNRDGGWRRLNVAVSRARYEMKVFSSLTSDMIDLSRTKSEGVAGLKSFLEYAEKGTSVLLVKHDTGYIPKASLVEIIADRIRQSGYEVHTNIGTSGYRIDMGIVNPDKKDEYKLGILCDGYNYSAARTVRDREVIQPDVLRMLGWRLHRIWTLDWLENSDRLLSEISDILNSGTSDNKDSGYELQGDRIKEETLSDDTDEIKDTVDISYEETKAYLIDYISCPVVQSGLPTDSFTLNTSRDLIIRQISDVLNAEAPICRDQLCRRVLSMWGITRIGNRINDHFNNLINEMDITRTGEGKELFLWNKDQDPERYMNYRVYNGSASDISPQEVSVAVKDVLEQQISLLRSDLIKDTARLLGYSRMGSVVEASMQRGLEMAITRGFAKEDNDRILLR